MNTLGRFSNDVLEPQIGDDTEPSFCALCQTSAEYTRLEDCPHGVCVCVLCRDWSTRVPTDECVCAGIQPKKKKKKTPQKQKSALFALEKWASKSDAAHTSKSSRKRKRRRSSQKKAK